jgi:hypothetical protein
MQAKSHINVADYFMQSGSKHHCKKNQVADGDCTLGRIDPETSSG